MSTWISRSGWSLASAGLLFLAGCGVIGGGAGYRDRAPQTVPVAGGAIVIGGPPGYCIDKAGSRLRRDAAFVLLGSCASIAGDLRAGQPARAGVLTASVSRGVEPGAAAAPSPKALETFLRSRNGRKALARDGKVGSVEILETRHWAGGLLVRLRDDSASVMPGTDPTYWRGLIDIGGYLVTVSVVSFADKPLSAGDGLDVLRAFIARIRAETAALATPARVRDRPPPRPVVSGFLTQ